MVDRNDLLDSQRGTCGANRQAVEAPKLDGPRTGGPWAGRPPRIVQPGSLTCCPDPGAGNISAGSQAPDQPDRKSHLARLVDAIQKSRRLQAAQSRRRGLHLVQGQKG
jgi:hypothetical protein